MDWTTLGLFVLIALAAAVGGAINAIAGGGTLVTFPILNAVLGTGADAVLIANATSKVGLVPGAFSSIFGFTAELRESKPWVGLLFVPATLGAVVGSVLLLCTSAAVFAEVVPWLILTAAVLFTFQPQKRPVSPAPGHTAESGADGVGEVIAEATAFEMPAESPAARWLAVASQFLIGVYGGYFGAGIGILTLAVIGLLGVHDIHRMNALKVLIASLINGVAGLLLIVVMHGSIAWGYVAVMCVGSAVGGYGAAHWSKKVDKTLLRRVIAGSSFALAGVYFIREFLY